MKVRYENGQFPHIGIPVGEPSRVSMFLRRRALPRLDNPGLDT